MPSPSIQRAKSLSFMDANSEAFPEWEDKKLGAIGTFRSGSGFPESFQGKQGLPYPFLKVSDMNSNGNENEITTSNHSVSDEMLALMKLKPIREDAIIFAKVGAAIFLERKRIVKRPFLIDNNMMSFSLKGTGNIIFFHHLFRSLTLSKYAQVGSLPSYNAGDISNITVSVPSLPEQEKIAEFFSALDERIELQAKKVSLLKEQKRGYQQRIFNRELAFTDENGNPYPEWTEKKLGEVAEVVGGGTPATGVSEYWGGDINWFSPTEIGVSKHVSSSTKKITHQGLNSSSAKVLPVGAVLLTSRASLGRMAILDEPASTNQGFQSLIPGSEVTSDYLYYLQPQVERYCDLKASGSTFKEISGKEVRNMSIPLPSLPEQEKIAEFLSALDENIVLHERRLELLKEQKKGYLQGIFG